MLIITGRYMLDPFFILQVPIHRLFQSFFKLKRGFPSQFFIQFGGIDGISQIMTRPIFYKLISFADSPSFLPSFLSMIRHNK